MRSADRNPPRKAGNRTRQASFSLENRVEQSYKGRMENPLLDLGFDVPFDRIEPSHILPAIDQLIEETEQAIDAIATTSGPRTYESTLGALEGATQALEHAMLVVGHLEGVATTPELRAAYNEAQPKVSAVFSSIPLNDGLWRALNEFAATDEAKSLPASRKRLLEKTLDEFRRHGAELEAAGKEALREIDIELSKVTTRFGQNVLDATQTYELVIDDEAKLAGLPESARAMARQAAEERGLKGWRFTLQAPSVIAVLTYLDDATTRESIWRAYNRRAANGGHDNRALIRRILELRRKKASLLGYRDFADLTLADRMAKTGEKAKDFIDDLRARTRAFFEEENRALDAFRKELEGDEATPLEPWDVGYYAEKLRKARFDLDEEELRPYFPAEQVVDGLFATAQKLYGITIKPRPAPVWNKAVRTFAIESQGGELISTFYVDLYPREDKRGGAWMSPLIVNIDASGKVGTHAALFCANVTPPTSNRPALLTHNEVETLFHEFGHLLHQALTKVDVRTLAGTNVAWDFVELPSQIMENWCWRKEVLDLFAKHYQTGETIPDALFQKMERAKTFRAANAQMRQLGFATVDLALHRELNPGDCTDESLMEFANAILSAHSPVSLPGEYAMLCAFGHLFSSPTGYGAGYYSYKWAEVLDADAFSRFENEGIFDPEVGKAFREQILERGDSRDPLDLFVAFMGREPQIDALLKRSGLLPNATTPAS